MNNEVTHNGDLETVSPEFNNRPRSGARLLQQVGFKLQNNRTLRSAKTRARKGGGLDTRALAERRRRRIQWSPPSKTGSRAGGRGSSGVSDRALFAATLNQRRLS